MRWADLDSLNHVNNVVYLDYAAEARAMLVADGVVGADEPVARIAVDFLQPLLLTTRPVRVVSRHDGDELVQEIDSDGVHARVTSTAGPAPALESHPTPWPSYPLRLRRSDLDESGHASATKLFEFFQEARILLFVSLLREQQDVAGRFVVARVEVTYGEPIAWRRETYPVQSWISRIGSSSITVEAEIVDGETVLARATSVLVGFDLPTQRSRTLSDQERSALEAFIPAG